MAQWLARHGGRPAHGRRAVVLVAAICAATSSGTALAAAPARTPSAEHLRQTYPLETAPPKSRPVAPPPARPASDRKPVRAAKKKNGGNLMSTFAVVVLVLVAVLIWGFVLQVWHILRRDPPEPAGADAADGADPADGADAADGVSGAPALEARSERTPSLAILRTSAADQVAPSSSPPPSPAAGTPQPEHERANRGSDRR